MSHVDDEILAAFVAGELGEHLAVHVAEHLDACLQCAARADAADPLAAAFAASLDPAVPEDLISAILTELDEPERLPMSEVLVGVGMLVLAGALKLLPGDLTTVTRPLHTFVSGMGIGARHLTGDTTTMMAWSVALSVAMLVGGVWSVRHARGGAW
jgi:predicted anti-sigma-YlaC factor YlaD